MTNVEGLKHCLTCDAQIQRMPCGVPYCPNPDCTAQKGAHDWELVPIILHMAATERLWQAIGLVPRPSAPASTAGPMDRFRRAQGSKSKRFPARALRGSRC